MKDTIEKLINEWNDLISKGRGNEAIFAAQNLTIDLINFLATSIMQVYGKDQFDKSKKLFQAAIEIDKANWVSLSNFCHILSECKLFKEAKQFALKAIECSNYSQIDTYHNAGVVLFELGEREEAEKMYKKCLELDPTKIQTDFNLGCLQLMFGNPEGWKRYECRLEAFPLLIKLRSIFTMPYWDGKPHRDKSLVIFSEQGIGDLIQFCRYIPKIKKQFKKIIVQCQEPMADMIQRTFNVEVIKNQNINWPPPPNCDYCIAVCSIPSIFNASPHNTSGKKYFTSLPRHIINNDKKKVGIIWSGNHEHKNDNIRSCYLQEFKQLSEINNIQLYGLQKDCFKRIWDNKPINLLENAEGLNIIHLSDKINDFEDVSSLISQMDLIISVDTAAAHMAGAMGKPVWLLISQRCDFRWGIDTDKSYWYNSMRIFRKKEDNWKPLFDEIKAALIQTFPDPQDIGSQEECTKDLQKPCLRKRSRYSQKS